MFWPSMNMNVHPDGEIKFHDFYQESCTTLSRLTVGNIPERLNQEALYTLI
jgi:hypothetical protein